MRVSPETPPRVVIGLDVGTSSVKAVAFGLGSVWRRITICEYPLLEPTPGHQVQDPATVMSAVRGALAACVGDVAGAEVIGISVGAGMHGLVALDEREAERAPDAVEQVGVDARAHGNLVGGEVSVAGCEHALHRQEGEAFLRHRLPQLPE